MLNREEEFWVLLGKKIHIHFSNVYNGCLTWEQYHKIWEKIQKELSDREEHEEIRKDLEKLKLL